MPMICRSMSFDGFEPGFRLLGRLEMAERGFPE